MATKKKVYRYHPQETEMASLAALLAKVRCKVQRRLTALEDAVSNMGYDSDALIKRFRKTVEEGEAFWR
jgi:hypothetical protein